MSILAEGMQLLREKISVNWATCERQSIYHYSISAVLYEYFSHRFVTVFSLKIFLLNQPDTLDQLGHDCTCMISVKCCPSLERYRLHTEVQVSMRFTLLRAAGPRWCKKRRDRTEVCNQLVPLPLPPHEMVKGCTNFHPAPGGVGQFIDTYIVLK